MAVSNRIVLIAVAFTVAATIYSLSELHSMSAQTAAADEVGQGGFVTASQSPDMQVTTVTRKPAVKTVATRMSAETKRVLEGASGTSIQMSGAGRKSYAYPHTELWGDVVVWGTQHSQPSAEACSEACKNHQSNADEVECNVWVWCGNEAKCGGQYKQCWLKHLVHPEASKPAKQGPDVFWTSGTLDVDITFDPSKGEASAVAATKDVPGTRKYHIVTSAQGAAVHWQIRIHYYWYKKVKAQCEAEGGCDMGGWTRLLHSGAADDLMQELPTMVVDPLPQDMVEHSWYIVLNRPYAFVQWCDKVNIPERYVLMAEPDHIYLRPLPNFMHGDVPAAFPFFYIEPAKPEHAKITQKFTGPMTRKQLEEIAPIGNSPTFMTMADMKLVMPQWMNTSIAIFKDTEASQVWGWVQEMYGFAFAAWIKGIKHFDLYLHMMAQPPWDANLLMAPNKPFYILHYTYGMDYKLTGEFMPGKYGEWRFDKRAYGGRPPKRGIVNPPKGMKNDLVRRLINSINIAAAAIPCWDKYAENGGKVDPLCTEDTTASMALAEKMAAENVQSS